MNKFIEVNKIKLDGVNVSLKHMIEDDGNFIEFLSIEVEINGILIKLKPLDYKYSQRLLTLLKQEK